jgi:hypothetical protein
LPERAPRSGISEGAPKNGIPEGDSKNGVSERAPYVAVESVIFYQLPTSVTCNGRATFFVSVIPSYLVEWRIEAMSHSDGPRPCGALTIYLCYELKSRRHGKRHPGVMKRPT